MSAAAPVMNPSSTTGRRAAAAPTMTPTSSAISRPPTAASTPSGSAASGRFTAIARSMAATLRRRPASSTPVPRPVTASGGAPVITAVIALAAVVLPIPISPSPTTSASEISPVSTSARPIAMARSASSGVIAGPRVMSAVPARTRALTSRPPAAPGDRRRDRPGDAHVDDRHASRPTPAARTLIAAPPATKFATIWAVTADG